MSSLADGLARAVRHHLPHVRCFSCLATELVVSEADVRNAAQMLVVQDGFMPARRACSGCLRSGDTVARVE
jgi:hypothetical protein